MHEVVGFRQIRNFHIIRIPEQFFAKEAKSDVAEKSDLCRQAGIFEIGAGGRSLFAGAHPFPVVLIHAGQGFGRALVCIHKRLRNQAR